MTNQDRLSENIERLRRLNLQVRQQLERAETVMPSINMLVDQLASVELVRGVAFAGEVIYDRALTAGAHLTDDSEMLQAAILVPGGVGVILWSREEFLAMNSGPIEPDLQQLRRRFVPFRECAPAIRGLLMPQLDSLVKRVVQMASPPRR